MNDYATHISNHLLPRTGAYHEIWLDGEKVLDSSVEKEPIYGSTYLPRKFKIGIAVPPSNDIDVYSQDIGLIAIVIWRISWVQCHCWWGHGYDAW